MNYETVKKLKDSGWKFTCTCSGHITCTGPTLEELIEACGYDFIALTNGGRFGWKAGALTSVPGLRKKEVIAKASAPTDAVAKLWLSLNTPPLKAKE